MKRLLVILIAMVALTSCYKAVIHRAVNTPPANVSIEVVTPTLTNGLSYDGDVTIIFDGEEYTLKVGESLTLPNTPEPGIYTYYVYTNPTSGAEVSYDSTTGAIIASVLSLSDGTIDPNPDEIFFGMETVEIYEDTDIVLTTELTAIGRNLRFLLELEGDAADRLESFSAILNGVAQQWDCINDEPYGDSASVIPALTKTSSSVSASITRSGDSYYLEGTIHLLGVMPEESQNLVMTLTYADSHPTSHMFESDVTELLSTFNDDKTTEMLLINTIETPTESSPNGSIGDWSTTNYYVDAK